MFNCIVERTWHGSSSCCNQKIEHTPLLPLLRIAYSSGLGAMSLTKQGFKRKCFWTVKLATNQTRHNFAWTFAIRHWIPYRHRNFQPPGPNLFLCITRCADERDLQETTSGWIWSPKDLLSTANLRLRRQRNITCSKSIFRSTLTTTGVKLNSTP
jgi:hypothetical protein